MAEPIVFEPYGPFVVPVLNLDRGRVVSTDQLDEWWEELDLDQEGLSTGRGVFVFSLKAGKGYTPFYVGKTSRQDFEHECFTPHKRDKYNHALASRSGTPVLSLIAYPTRRGAVNHNAIDQLELELIQYAYERNPDGLRNERRIEDIPRWSIAGALRHGRGKPSNEATELRRILGL